MARPESKMTLRALARLGAAVATSAALYACVGGKEERTSALREADAPRAYLLPEGIMPGRADLDYFPNRFPTIQGEIEPLPAQF